MSALIKHQQQKHDLDYFRQIATIASKGGTPGMTPEIMMNIMLTAKDLGISPLKALNGGFYIVNGKISMSTAMMADRIRKDGHSIKIPEWTDQKCVIIGIRKDNADSIKFEYTMADAERAGLTSSPTWKKFPKQMLYNRAMSTLARTLFSDVVGNAYSEDEKWDIMDVPPEKRPLQDPDQEAPETQTITGEIMEEQMSDRILDDLLKGDGLDTQGLSEFVQSLAEKKKCSVNEVITSALNKDLYPKFKKLFVNRSIKSEDTYQSAPSAPSAPSAQ